jgi:hypothetical protein
VVSLAEFLGADCPVDLPLLVLAGLPEGRQQDDSPIRSTPVRYPGRNLAKPDPEFPDGPFQVIRPRPAQFGAPYGEQAADLIDAFVVAVAEAVQPVADLWLQLEAIQSRVASVTDSEATCRVPDSPRMPDWSARF